MMDAQLRLKPGDAVLTRGHVRCGQHGVAKPCRAPAAVSVRLRGADTKMTGIKDRRHPEPRPKNCRHLPNDNVVQNLPVWCANQDGKI